MNYIKSADVSDVPLKQKEEEIELLNRALLPHPTPLWLLQNISSFNNC